MKFAHVNIIAENWQKLAQFYIDTFDCTPVYPERDLTGEWIDKLTGIKDVHIKGIHLQLPEYNTDGPTLEIFEYNHTYPQEKHPQINKQGYGHITFHVDNVEEILKKVQSHGGEKYGELVEKEIIGLGTLKVIYVKDIEGNIVEIQNWKKD